jgi:hypothetical protein
MLVPDGRQQRVNNSPLEDVMERRNLLAGLAVLVLGVFMLAGTASAHKPPQSKKQAKPAVGAEKGCVVETLPSFIDQGLETEASSVADIIEVECEHEGKLQYDGEITISDTELFDRCGKGTHLSWSPTQEFAPTVGPSTKAKLDNDGNASVVLWAGPECKPGETDIMVDETTFPFETYTATFTVLPPETTKEGVFALPEKKVEDDVFSSVATIIQVEFPIVETKVAVNAEQLFTRCGKFPHIEWVGPNEKFIAFDEGRLEGAHALETDDDGNAFVVALGDRSCQPGKVKIEASLEEAESFNSVFGEFEIEFPRPTI